MERKRRSRSNSKRKKLDKYLKIKYIVLYFVFSVGIGILYNLYKDETIPIASLIKKSLFYGIILTILIFIGLKIAQRSVKTKRITGS